MGLCRAGQFRLAWPPVVVGVGGTPSHVQAHTVTCSAWLPAPLRDTWARWTTSTSVSEDGVSREDMTPGGWRAPQREGSRPRVRSQPGPCLLAHLPHCGSPGKLPTWASPFDPQLSLEPFLAPPVLPLPEESGLSRLASQAGPQSRTHHSSPSSSRPRHCLRSATSAGARSLCPPCAGRWPLTAPQLCFQCLRLSAWPCMTQLKRDLTGKPFLAPRPVRGAPGHTHTLAPMHGRTWGISRRMVLLRGKDHVALTSVSPVGPTGLGTQ